MNVTRLRIVYELSRRGSVTAVAEALWITPSAVSEHLAAFERETATKLIERAGAVRDGLEVAELFEDPLVIVLTSGHRLAASDEVLWSELADEALIVEPRAPLFAYAVASPLAEIAP